MVDTLETAHDYDLSISHKNIMSPYLESELRDILAVETSFTQLFNDWCALTQVLNALNRSMGMDDAYPFVISLSALKKLRFVHHTILDHLN